MARSLYYAIPMRQRTLVQRVAKAALILSAAAVFVAVAFPHAHNGATHRQESCRACKIQDGFSAAQPARALVVLQPCLVAMAHIPSLEAPCLERAETLHASRAPPIAS